MPDHRIRLRAGWECLYRAPDGDGAEVARRVDLPLPWPTDLPARFRLARTFGRPPVDLATETVVLELKDAPGLVAARLNGRPVELPQDGPADLDIPLDDPLLPRNGLILEVDLGGVAEGSAFPWGAVSLVIRPR